jgi:hypothetical protein
MAASMIQAFNAEGCADGTGPTFSEWALDMARVLNILQIQPEDPRRLDYLIVCGGETVKRAYEPTRADDDTYEGVVARLSEHFNPAANINMNVFHFMNTVQEEGDSFDEFVAKLRRRATACNYQAEHDRQVIYQIIKGCLDIRIKEEALARPNMTLNEVIQFGRSKESVARQITLMQGGQMVVNRVFGNENRQQTSRSSDDNRIDNSRAKSDRPHDSTSANNSEYATNGRDNNDNNNYRNNTNNTEYRGSANNTEFRGNANNTEYRGNTNNNELRSSNNNSYGYRGRVDWAPGVHGQRGAHTNRESINNGEYRGRGDWAPGSRPQTRDRRRSCYNCGDEFPHTTERPCAAIGEECENCGKENHFAQYCRSPPRRQNAPARRVRIVEQDDDHSDESNVWHVTKEVNAVRSPTMPHVELDLAQTTVSMAIDTGAEVNILDEATYKRLKMRPILSKSRIKLFGYGSGQIQQMGTFNGRVLYRGQYRNLNFIVTNGNNGNLLSYESAVTLGIVPRICVVKTKTDCELDKKQESASKVKRKGRYEDLFSKYPNLFSGKTGVLKNYEVKLHIDESVRPVYQRLRPVPVHLQQAVESELQRMIEEDIIEPVNGPTPWVSPIVAVPKADKSEVRICTDSRCSNKAIQPCRHSCPTIDDMTARLCGSKVFSSIDLKSSFQQLRLAPESRYITAFSTHKGIFQYKRLNYGINTASHELQKALEQVLQGLPGVFNMVDDIIIHGRDDDEHDERLHGALQRLDDSGFSANVKKCDFGVDELDFFGLTVSAEGIAIQAAKQEALKNAEPPQSASEVKSLLGLANYCSRWIPHLSTTIKKLRDLTTSKAKWKWGPEEQEALEQLKASVDASKRAYFNPEWHTEITVDASPVGLGCFMVQYDPDTPTKRVLVMDISRSLTPVETRYSQIEREALAVVWACERLHFFLFNKKFTIRTDNRAVMLIFGKGSSSPKGRVERWCLRLSPYNFDIVHIEGAGNIADYISRHPTPEKSSTDHAEVAERYINMISQAARPSAISHDTFLKATREDSTLQEVTKMIRQQPHEHQTTAAFTVCDKN